MSGKLIENKKFGMIDIISKLMHEVEEFVDMTGDKKKQYVIKHMKFILDDVEYKQYEVIIADLIEFIIAISKTNNNLDLNKIKAKCCIV
jgi:hypothetical protein